jgi:hypothetical protein
MGDGCIPVEFVKFHEQMTLAEFYGNRPLDTRDADEVEAYTRRLAEIRIECLDDQARQKSMGDEPSHDDSPREAGGVLVLRV